MSLDPSVASLLLSVATGSGGGQGETAVPGTASRLPDALIDRLAVATRTLLISGTITQGQGDGTLTLRTQYGALMFQGGRPVPVGTQAVLSIAPPGLSAAALSARPVQANLLLAGAPAAAPAQSAAAASVPIAGSALPSAPILPGGHLLAGVASAPLGGPAPQAGAPAGGPAGGPASAAAGAAQPPGGPGGATAAPAGQAAASAGAGPAAAGSADAAPAANSGPRASLPQAMQVYGRTAGAPPPAPSAPPAAAPAAVTAGGTAVASGAGPAAAAGPGAGATGPVGDGVPAARPPGQVPAGAVRPGAIPNAGPPGPSPGGPATVAGPQGNAPPPESGTTTALRQVLAALSEIDPALATQAAQRSVAQPGPQMAGTLLLFLVAARGGDARGLLGERSVRLLEAAGRSDAVNRLSTEMGATTRTTTETTAGEWRSYTVPVYDRGAWSDLRLHVGPGSPDDQAQDPARKGGKRFVVDVTLSGLGPLQIDGNLAQRHLDLAVRTREAFDQTERREMTAAFAAVCESTGLTGSLRFQPGNQNWLHLASPSARTRRG